MKTCIRLIEADWQKKRIIQTNAPNNSRVGQLTTAKKDLGHLYPFHNLWFDATRRIRQVANRVENKNDFFLFSQTAKKGNYL